MNIKVTIESDYVV